MSAPSLHIESTDSMMHAHVHICYGDRSDLICMHSPAGDYLTVMHLQYRCVHNIYSSNFLVMIITSAPQGYA